jgi:hypothetical protein
MTLANIKLVGQTLLVPSEWANLIDYCQKNPYSEITLKVQDGIPVMIEKAVNKIKL